MLFPYPVLEGGLGPLPYFRLMVIRETSDAPGGDLIPLADAKAYLRVDHSSDDTLIQELVNVAVTQVSDMANTRWKTVQAYGYLEDFYNCRFPVGPVTAITAVHYKRSGDGAYTVLPTSKYYYSLEGVGARIAFDNYPSLEEDAYERVRITFSYGYDASVQHRPPQLKQAAFLLLSHYYDNRTAVSFTGRPQVVPMAVDSLVSTFRYL